MSGANFLLIIFLELNNSQIIVVYVQIQALILVSMYGKNLIYFNISS